MQIDLNCDMGESFGAWPMGDDEGAVVFAMSIVAGNAIWEMLY